MRIDLEKGIMTFSPGETLRGEASWELEQAGSVELRLFWRTEGQGNQDLVIVETVPFERPQPRESRRIEIVLPDGPWSFNGILIHLVWGLELIAEPGEQVERVDLTLAPGGREIQLQPAFDPVEAKAEKMASGCLRLFGKELPKDRHDTG
jgi:hypothetical protein